MVRSDHFRVVLSQSTDANGADAETCARGPGRGPRHDEGTGVDGLWPGALYGYTSAGRCRRHRPAGQRRSRQLAERAPLGAAGPRGRCRHRRGAHHRAAASRGPPRPRPDADPGRCRPRRPLADRRCRRAAARHHPAVPGRRGVGAEGGRRLPRRVPRPRGDRLGRLRAHEHGPAAAVTGPLGRLGPVPGRARRWSLHLAPHPNKDDALAAEAAWLLTRLEGLATEMRAGFDPATSAEHVLDALPSAGARSRAGVLIGAPTDRPVPLALRGSLRVPWPDPRDDHGVIGDAWHHGRAGVVVLDDGRVQLAMPLRDARDRQYGIVISDGVGSSVPPADLLEATSAVARQHQGLIAVALAFGGLRERAGIEERERLARQIHDGIAQELVALGFRVDRLKRLPDEDLRPEIVQLRTEVTRILGDVRSHIGDLRLTVRPEGGLGAAITSQLQVFGAATGAAVTLRLSESSYRLPAHVETGLYRIFLDFVADARRAAQTEDIEVEVSLRTQAPDARMVLRQSGTTRLTESELSPHLPASLGAV